MSVVVLVLLLAVGALWGASFLFIRVAVEQWGPVALIEARVLLAGLALWLAVTVLRRTQPAWRAHGRRYLLLGTLSAAVPFTLIAVAELHLTASLAATLNATSPLFTLLIGAARGQERLTLRRLAGVGLGIVGVAVLVGLGPLRPTPTVLFAVAASLLAAFFYGLGGVYAKRHFADIPPTTVATGQQLAAAAVLLPVTLLAPPEAVPDFGTTGAVLGLALPCTALGFALFYRLVAHSGPTTALTVTYLVPLFGLLWGALVLGEPLGPSMLVGLAIVLASLGLITHAPRPRARRGSDTKQAAA